MWIETAQSERVLRIALNRPEKRNALNIGLCGELVTAFETANNDQRIGAILLVGNGKSFCAGMDIEEAVTADPDSLSQIHEELFTICARMTKPIVAAVHGAALAGGTGLAANTHIVFAAPDATFGLTEIRIGLWPFLIFRAVSLCVGERRTTELALTGRTFPAPDALNYGLVHQVVAEPEAAAFEIARQLSERSPVAVRSGLEYVLAIRGRNWTEAGEIGRQIRQRVIQAEDFAEGVAAFRNKRNPIWPSLSK